MDGCRQWSTTSVSLGDFSQIRFSIYNGESLDLGRLRAAAASLQELGVLATVDTANYRVWEFEGVTPGPKHDLPDGLVILHSGKCKAQDLLSALTKLPPSNHTSGAREQSVGSVDDGANRARSRPTPLDLYEHFIRANLTRLSLSVAKNNRLIPMQLSVLLAPLSNSVDDNEENSSRTLSYMAMRVFLTLVDNGGLFVATTAQEELSYAPLVASKPSFDIAVDQTQSSEIILVPGGMHGRRLKHHEIPYDSRQALLRGEIWRSSVIIFLKQRGLILSDPSCLWVYVQVLIDSKFANHAARPLESWDLENTILEWPAYLCFSVDGIEQSLCQDKKGTSHAHDGTSGSPLDPLNLALESLKQEPFRGKDSTAQRVITNISGFKKTPGTHTEIDVSDYLVESPTYIQTNANIEDQNVYPTPSSSLPAQATPGAIVLDANPGPESSFLSIAETPFDIEAGERRKDSDTYNGDDEAQVERNNDNSYVTERKDSDDGPDSNVMKRDGQLDSIDVRDHGLPAPTKPEAYASGSSIIARSFGRHSTISRQSLGRLDFTSITRASDRKYSLGGRFPASPISRRISLAPPTSIARTLRLQEGDDSSSDESSNASRNDEERLNYVHTASIDIHGPENDVGDSFDVSTADEDTQRAIGHFLQEILVPAFFAESDSMEFVSRFLAGRDAGKIDLPAENKVDLAQIITRQSAISTWSGGSRQIHSARRVDEMKSIFCGVGSAVLSEYLPLAAPDSKINLVQPPRIKVRRGNEDWELSNAAPAFWEALGLEPVCGQKNICGLCLCPDSDALRASCCRLLEAIEETWDALRLGKHTTPSAMEQRVFSISSSNKPSPNHITMEVLKAYEEAQHLSSDLSSGSMTMVIYLVAPYSSSSEFTELCSKLRELLVPDDMDVMMNWPQVVCQKVPLQAVIDTQDTMIFDFERASTLAFELYERILRREPSPHMGKIPIYSAPSVVLATGMPPEIAFRLAEQPSANPLMEESPFHIAYCADANNNWITCAWTDSTGSCQHLASYRISAKGTVEDIIGEIWQTTCEILSFVQVHWRLYIAKDAPFQPKEETAWLSLARTHSKPPSIKLHLVQLSRPTTISADSSILRATSSTKPDVASPLYLRTAPSTPAAATPLTPCVSSPVVPATPSTLSSAFPFPESIDPYLSKNLIDKTEESWCVILPHVRNRSALQTQYRPAVSSGSLFKRTGSNTSDPLTGIDVDLIAIVKTGQTSKQMPAHTASLSQPGTQSAIQGAVQIQGQGQGLGQSPMHSQGQTRRPSKEEADRVLKEIIGMYRDLGTLARIRKQEGVRSVRPWHVAAARKGVDGLSEGMRNIRFV